MGVVPGQGPGPQQQLVQPSGALNSTLHALQTPQLLQATQSQLPSVNVTQPAVQRVQNVQQNVATSSVLNPGEVPLSALAASGVSGAQANFPVPQQGHIQMTASGDQTHPNYFQEAIAKQAAAVATAAQRNQARRSDDANIPQFPFPELQ